MFCAIAFVLGGLTLAFVYLGTPAHQRLVSLDERRASDLEKIATTLNRRYQVRGLPAVGAETDLENDFPRDPITGQHYQFRRVDATRYVLCAVFATAGSAGGDEQRWTNGIVWPLSDWRHAAGRTCYELNVTESPPTPRRV